jgi:hypothetical protein
MTRRAAAKPEPTTIEAAMLDPSLLGAGFGDPKTWKQWRTIVKAAFGIPLNREEARAFAAIAGGRKPPAQRVRELWCVTGKALRQIARSGCSGGIFQRHMRSHRQACPWGNRLRPGRRGFEGPV